MVQTRNMVKNAQRILNSALRTAGGRTAAAAVSSLGANVARNVVQRQLENIFNTPASRGGVGSSTRSSTGRRRGGTYVGRTPGGTRVYKALRGISTAKYKGKFKKPRKLKKTQDYQFLAKGFHITDETYGTLADPHCGYITHSTYHLQHYATVIMAALLRSLFKKAGYVIDAKNQNISLMSYLTSALPAPDGAYDKFTLQFITQNVASNALTVSGHTIDENQTINNLCQDSFPGFTAMLSWISNYLYGSETVQDREIPVRLLLTREQIVTTVIDPDQTMKTVLAELNLGTEHISIYARSDLKVQNRTKADLTGTGETGDSLSADRVDNQPLYGYLYEFKHADPRLKTLEYGTGGSYTIGQQTFNCIKREGVKLTRGESLAYDTGYNEPPNAKHFQNCTKISKVYLQPGDMKSSTIVFKESGLLVNVLKRLACKINIVIGSDAFLSGVRGKSAMLCLEEILRTAGSNPITIAYERQLKVGAYSKSRKTKGVITTKLVVPNQYSVTS